MYCYKCKKEYTELFLNNEMTGVFICLYVCPVCKDKRVKQYTRGNSLQIDFSEKYYNDLKLKEQNKLKKISGEEFSYDNRIFWERKTRKNFKRGSGSKTAL